MNDKRSKEVAVVHYTSFDKRGKKKYLLRFPSRYLTVSRLNSAIPLIGKILLSVLFALLLMTAVLLAGVAISLIFLKS